jgi:hypothetical protein
VNQKLGGKLLSREDGKEKSEVGVGRIMLNEP